ncbi:MAG TPA: ELWxxDGT repeat protein [Thermoanaerobaculia bacterium]|nr:ELWxxDGT repeat protein [Thermoanaerobaculia bacterium]
MRSVCNQLLIALTLASPALAAAPTASLVADLQTGAGRHDSQLAPLAVLGDKVLFSTFDSTQGSEIWVTDGTDAGTEMLSDGCPGECSGLARFFGTARGLAFWVSAIDGIEGSGVLVVSDGTRHGTRRLDGVDAELTVGGAYFQHAAMLGDVLLFQGCTPATGCELWRSDGTDAGTALVADLVAGPDGAVPGRFAVAGRKLYFMVSRADGLALYTSDGTGPGTAFVEAIGPEAVGQAPQAAGNRVFFLRDSAETGTPRDVWTSDGTPAGTRSLRDFVPGLTYWNGGNIAQFKAIGDHVYFVASDEVHNGVPDIELWRSDGTAKGTFAVTHYPDGHAPLFPYMNPDDVTELGGRTLYVASINDGFSQARRLWSTDGKTSTVVVDHCESCSWLDRLGDRVLFRRGGAAAGGVELMATDGTAAGTRSLAPICTTSCAALGDYFAPLLGEGIFLAASNQGARELWRTDGTAAGTARFATLPDGVYVYEPGLFLAGGRVLAAGAEWVAYERTSVKLLAADVSGGARVLVELPEESPSSSPRRLLAAADRLLFVADTGAVPQLWSSTGTAAGTAQVTELTAPDEYYARDAVGPVELTRLGDKVVFAVRERWDGSHLWTSDGTATGTFALAAGDDTAVGLTAHDGQVYFVREGPGFDEVWRTDGTDAGTAHVFILPGRSFGRRFLTAVGDELYFATYVDGKGNEIWRSSLTGAGVTQVTNFPEAFIFDADPSLTKLGNDVFFLGPSPEDGEVWKISGTPATVTRLVDARPGAVGSRPTDLLVFGGALYFLADTSEHERALFRSDGTTAGTIALHQFKRPLAEDPRAELLAVDGRLYFAADDGVHGRELWTSDGTAAGTRMVADIFSGLASSSPAWLTAVGGRLYFAAHDDVHGTELWTSDGTAAATTLVHDIAPGALSSRPEELELQGSRLFFAADDGLTGRELWVLDLAQATGVCVPTSTVLCLGGRFRVEAAWKDFAGHRGVGHTVSLTADTGAFWFFDAANVELVLKVLDGRGVNGHHWVFYGALSSVEYALTVTDVQTGLTARYRNPAGRLASVGDVTGFGPLGSFSLVESVSSASGTRPRTSSSADPTAIGTCTPAPTRLCLRGGRFAVEASWKDFAGNTGVGTAVPLTADTGWFWFFGPDNVEVMLKVLDGRPLNGKHWVFYGALSSVEYTLRVTDTQTGAVRTYSNPSGNLASVADIGAF